MKKCSLGLICAGSAAGTVTGILGAGGGMILLPLLSRLTDLEQRELFSVSVSIMAPVCLVSLFMMGSPLPWTQALPYLAGSALGGILAGIAGKRIPVLWLHRILGILILWGGFRNLCS